MHLHKIRKNIYLQISSNAAPIRLLGGSRCILYPICTFVIFSSITLFVDCVNAEGFLELLLYLFF